MERWYQHEELSEWADRTRQAQAQRVWISFNNAFDGFAIKNAATLANIGEHLTAEVEASPMSNFSNDKVRSRLRKTEIRSAQAKSD